MTVEVDPGAGATVIREDVCTDYPLIPSAVCDLVDTGHETGIILMGEAAPLIKDSLSQQVQGVGIPALKELIEFVVAHEVPITV